MKLNVNNAVGILGRKCKMNVERLKQLKIAMEKLEEYKTDLEWRKAEFEQENEQLYRSIVDLNKEITECKEVLKENAEAGFKKDGQKKRLGGFGIRVSIVPEYDETEAFNWAKEKDLFLQLDKNSFEKVAKTGELDFVKLVEKITVTAPTKHDKIVIEE